MCISVCINTFITINVWLLSMLTLLILHRHYNFVIQENETSSLAHWQGQENCKEAVCREQMGELLIIQKGLSLHSAKYITAKPRDY